MDGSLDSLTIRPTTSARPVAGLVAEHTRSGRWLFRHRGHIPVPLVIWLVVRTARSPGMLGSDRWAAIWLALGLVLGVISLGIRGFSVGYASPGTSGRGTRQMRADALNTTGAYSIVRHPLYLGNLILWLGVAAFTGEPVVMTLVALLFYIYYERIMIAEESFLHDRFGEEFEEWAARVPALFPGRGSLWRPPQQLSSLRFTLGRDHQALCSLLVATFAIQAARMISLEGFAGVSPALWSYLGFGIGTYPVLRGLKRRTLLNESREH